MRKIVTLKDVSAATGVSLTSVHRALYNKEGISGKLSQIILRKAKELGYKTNYAASSLKRKALQIAIVLPDGGGSGRFYYSYFWRACRDYRKEVDGLNVRILEFAFSEEGSLIPLLEDIYRTHGDNLDGLLIVPVSGADDMRIAIDKYIEKGVQVALVDNDIPDCRRLCCISPHDASSGRLGAEFLSAITNKPGKVLISAGSAGSASHIHNIIGFTAYINENNIPLRIHKIYGYEDSAVSYAQARAFLEENDDVAAFYAVTARETLPLCQAVIDSGRAGKIRGMGSDLFPESARMLRDDVVQALLYKNPYEKAYKGLKILCEALIRNEKPKSPCATVPIGIIMKNNLPFFQEFI
ncbi:MAG: LacI family DNA-binding transcriptional regulator [Spirochaetales bacterium]|nr:LacI family DNA-binding transcriptional regulator [Spirochaetales bacterium]